MQRLFTTLAAAIVVSVAMAVAPSPASAAFHIPDPVTGLPHYCIVSANPATPTTKLIFCSSGQQCDVYVYLRAQWDGTKWVITVIKTTGSACPSKQSIRGDTARRAVEAAGQGMLGAPGSSTAESRARANASAPYVSQYGGSQTSALAPVPTSPYTRSTVIDSFQGGYYVAKEDKLVSSSFSTRSHTESTTSGLTHPTGTSNKLIRAELIINVPRTANTDNGVGRRIRIHSGDGYYQDFQLQGSTPFPIYYHYPNAYDPALDTYGRGPVQQRAQIKIMDLDDGAATYVDYYYDAQPINSPWPVAGASTPVSQVQPDYNDYGTRGECDPDWNPCWSPSPTAVFFNIAAKIDHPAMPTCLEAQDAVVQAWGVSNATNVPYGACKRVDWQRWKITTLDCVYYVEKKPVYVNGVIEYRIVGQRYSKWSDPQPGI